MSDPLLARQIAVLYLEYLEKQVPPDLLKKISAKSNAMLRSFNTFRPKLDGKELTENDIRNILRDSHDSARRRAAWEASKKVGQAVVGDLKELVALRNEAARKLGFKNFVVLRLYCNEQNQEQLLKLFDQLDELTREPFHKAKAGIDAALAASYGITVAELRPWHYHDPFFQEVPDRAGRTARVGLQAARHGRVVPVVLRRHRAADRRRAAAERLVREAGQEPARLLRPTSTAQGDVRVLENIVPGWEWLGTSLHELGHAVYSKNIPRSLPYVLRTEAHPLCTEGVAMMFERFAQNVDWLQAMGAKVPEPDRFRAAAARLQRNRMLVFARYCQVMFRFETELYGNPDQDLNRLWWDLVEKYQEIKRPEGRNEPDFASKYHLTSRRSTTTTTCWARCSLRSCTTRWFGRVLPGTPRTRWPGRFTSATRRPASLCASGSSRRG